MKAPLSWLRELTPLDVDPRDREAVGRLAGELDALGLVVEKVESVGQGFDQVVLAKVVEIAAIEGADRIRRIVVDAGGDDPVEVVCGAWNFAVGDVVPLAPVGSALPGDFRIERRKMKGVVSNGMLCSGRELELSDDHAGILVLASEGSGAERLELGTSLAEHLGFGPDVVYELDVEPNRPDCLSMVGIARDLAARFTLPLVVPEPVLGETGPPAAELATIEIVDGDLCPQFVGRVMSGLIPVSSPALVQRRLMLCGMRPISHVVDASNYVMLEFGQPTHPYDLDLLGGRGLRVRAARPGEELLTLDGTTRVLGNRPARVGEPFTALDAVICDAEDRVVGIAGAMGGQSSEISETTSTMLLEAARFTAVSVGRTARHAGLRTEASIRFERGVDAEGMERASARVCELVLEAARAAGIEPPTVARGAIDVVAVPFERRHVSVRPSRVELVLGLQLSLGEISDLLMPIGYGPAGAVESDESAGASALSESPGSSPTAAGARLELVVPSWRPDVSLEEDLIEDVARTYGYRNIPSRSRRSPYVGRLDEVQVLRRRLRRLLCGLGADEAWTNSLVDPAEQRLDGSHEAESAVFISLENPMVGEESVLRRTLLPGLLASLRHNVAHRNPEIRLFEIGDVFGVIAASLEEGRAAVPDERERVGVVLARSGDGVESAVRAWRVLEDGIGIAGVDVVQPGYGTDEPNDRHGWSLAGLHPARSGWLVSAGRAFGILGEIDPGLLTRAGVTNERVGWLEFDLRAFASCSRRPELARDVSKYPSSDIDLAFSVSESVAAGAVAAVLREAAADLAESVELFDTYRGAGLEEGTRSLAFRLRLRASDRTLTEIDVADARSRCIAAAEQKVGATLR